MRAIQDVRERREKWGRVKGVSIDSAESRAKQEPERSHKRLSKSRSERGRLSSVLGAGKDSC